MMKPNRASLEERGIRDWLFSEWRFLSLSITVLLFLVMTWVRFNEVETEVSRQSLADSVSSVERWTLMVSSTFSTCWQRADSLENMDLKRAARRSCDAILYFAPRLRSGQLPEPPTPRVWRPRRPVAMESLEPLLGSMYQ